MSAATRHAKIGTPLEGRPKWLVEDVFDNGNPLKWVNADLANYSVMEWHGGFVACLTGNIIRGRLGRMRVFKTAVAAAIAAEQSHAARLEACRAVNAAQRESENREYPSHDRVGAR